MRISKELLGIALLIIMMSILFPLFALLILHNPSKIGIGELDSWINFYGAYFGAILSGIITLLIIKLTISIEKKKIYIDNENFIKFFIYEYIPYNLVQIKTAVDIIKRSINDEVVYIPYHELIIDPNYYENISKLDISFSEKFEFLSVLHDIKSLNYLLKKSEETRGMQNSIMINKNIDIIRTKVLILSQLQYNDKCFKLFDEVNEIYQNVVYPEIKSDALNYIEFSNSLISKAKAITEKYSK